MITNILAGAPSKPSLLGWVLVTDSYPVVTVCCPRALGIEPYQACDLHFVTFSCYRRQPLLASAHAKRWFEVALEQARRQYGFYVTCHGVMPEHVHVLSSEPGHGTLARARQSLVAAVLQWSDPSWTQAFSAPAARLTATK